jgi:hypothetical protein
MKLRAIRKGEAYSARCTSGVGCIRRKAEHDGLLVESDEGDELVTVADVEAELVKLQSKRRSGKSGRQHVQRRAR